MFKKKRLRSKITFEAIDKRNIDLPLYPLYSPEEDVFNQGVVVRDIDPEDISKKKVSEQLNDNQNQPKVTKHLSGSELDVPGAELDDTAEEMGNEDEENNYYSLGGDDHNDLEERNLDE